MSLREESDRYIVEIKSTNPMFGSKEYTAKVTEKSSGRVYIGVGKSEAEAQANAYAAAEGKK